MSEMAINIEADRNMDFWTKVASELESGLLSGWEDSLFDCRASGYSVSEVDEFFWDEEFDSDSVLYGVVDVSRPYNCDFEDEVVIPVAMDSGECGWDDFHGEWDDPLEWFEESFDNEVNLMWEGSMEWEDEDFVQFDLDFVQFDLFDSECQDSLSVPQQDEMEREEIWGFVEWKGSAAMYRLTWDTDPVEGLLSDLSGWSPGCEGLCWVGEECILGLGQWLLPTVSGIVAGLSGRLSLDQGLGLQVCMERPPLEPPWRGSDLQGFECARVVVRIVSAMDPPPPYNSSLSSPLIKFKGFYH